VPDPRRWWPWDHGSPHLYRLRVEVAGADASPSDVWEGALGLRTVALDGWTLRVNGRPVYLRGANWVPAGLLPGRVSAPELEAWLDLARAANMNALRVWGGGLREKRAFYEACDRLGILLWQEFPFACAFVARYPRRPEYLALVEAEVGAIVRDLRHHPSVALWCGGNEFSPKRNRPLVAAIRKAVAQHDATRPFLPVSPHGGDSHFWDVWHGLEPPAAYRRDPARFASEFGLQALPSVESLRRFLPKGDLWPPGEAWEQRGANLPILRRYAEPWRHPAGGLASDASLGDAIPHAAPSRPSTADRELRAFVEASQRAQAEGLQIAIEHYRRRKADGAGGVLVWQFNEPWPAICWSLVDAYGTPKRAYNAVRRLYTPVLICLDHPVRAYGAGDSFSPNVWLINDSAVPFPRCHLRVELVDGRGEVALAFEAEADLPPLSAQVAGRVCWTIPPGSATAVRAQVRHQGRTLSTNHYDLSVCDQTPLSPVERLRGRLRRWVKAL
jgi:beta-mannosidase